MPTKKPNSTYDRDGNFDIELYVIRTTRASKVPLKVQDEQVLRMRDALLNKGKKPVKKKALARCATYSFLVPPNQLLPQPR